MAATNELQDRRVVPRWRTFRETLLSNELAGELPTKPSTMDATPFLHQKEQDWLHEKTLPFAVDLVSAASLFGASDASRSAAEFILANQGKCSNVASGLAKGLLGIPEALPQPVDPVTTANIRAQLRIVKAQRLSAPGNAFVWTDLARLYVLLGQKEQAKGALRIALQLAPNERFVVRSAVRCYLHSNDPDLAIRLLRSCPRTPADPWLAAAEVAVSTIIKKTPRFMRAAQGLLKNDNIHPFHRSELASAVASLELNEGSNRKASKLFQFSLKSPTENAIAQYVWASKPNGFSEIDPRLLKAHDACEARTFAANNNADWEAAVQNARDWSNAELFSARPRMVASSIAAYFLDDTSSTDASLRDGLSINPGHPGLVNSLAFSLTWKGRLAEAADVFKTLNMEFVKPVEAVCLSATAGLMLIRGGDVAEGRLFYEKAIESAEKINNDYLRSLAALHLAHELVIAGEPTAAEIFTKAYNQATKQNTTNLPLIAKRIAARIEGVVSVAGHTEVPAPVLAGINNLLRKSIPDFGSMPFAFGDRKAL
jgi:tetratricopeptide (TPR) repeat protein